MFLVSMRVGCHDERRASATRLELLLLMYYACRVAHLLAELHRLQWMMHRANRFLHSTWDVSEYEHSASFAASLPLQNSCGGVLPSGLDAGTPASQTQLLPRMQIRTTLQEPVDQPSLDGDAGHAHGMVTAQSRRPHAPDPGTLELMHKVQRRTGQRPTPTLRRSRRGTHLVEGGLSSAQNSPERPVADSTHIVRSEEAPRTSAECPHFGQSAHPIPNGHTAGACQQKSNERMLAPLNPNTHWSASDPTHVPGHTDDQGSRSSSAEVVVPHRSATHMRYDHVPWQRWHPAYLALQQ